MTTLLVAATGGHLKQLHLLHQRVEDVKGPYRWVTFDRPQSQSMLADEDVRFVPFIGSRDPRGTALGFRHARRLVDPREVSAVVSTGSAIAIPYLNVAHSRGIPAIYVESAARTQGPSLTGRMLARRAGLDLRTQYEHWATDRWKYRGSVFDVFERAADEPRPAVAKVVVTLGTLEYPFTRLVDRVRAVLGEDVEIVWQVGGTDAAALGPQARTFMPERELVDAMRDADVVIAHAGVGSALTALEAGKAPVLIPRRHAHGEHVDDHQEQIAQLLVRRGLAVSCEAGELDLGHIAEAAAMRVVMKDAALRKFGSPAAEALVG